jgi:IS605 OrfB family transposase
MDDASHRAVLLPLAVPQNRVEDVHETHVHYQHCQNRASEYCWGNAPKQPDDLITTNRDVENALYHPLRDETNELHANLVQNAIKGAVSATKTCKSNWKAGDRISKPVFTDEADPSYAMSYDSRSATLYKYKVSLATLYGRVECRYILPAELDGTPYEQYVLGEDWAFAESKLVFDGDEFWLCLICKKPTPLSPIWAGDAERRGSDTRSRIRVLGVDLNVDNYSVVTSLAGFHGNANFLNHRRTEYETVRAGLQQTGTRSAHTTMQEMNGREWRYFDAYAHECANGIVSDAVRSRCTHVAFEKLTRIRTRISNRPRFQQWLFGRIRAYATYKLEALGILVGEVSPRKTSKCCSNTECDSCTTSNRDEKMFECVECGLELNADYNAARNVALQWFVENDGYDQFGRTCQAGRATSQVALKSGIVSPDGEFESIDWLSTDKPTSSLVGT